MTDKEREAQCLFKAWAQDHLDLDYEIAPEEWGNDGAFKWAETGNFFRCWQAARAPLLARLVEAEKDTARLDWVEAQGGCGIGYQNYDYRHHVGHGMLSLRELCDEQLAAIDNLKGK